MSLFSKSRRSRSGQSVLLVSLAAVPMIAMIGLVTDLGYMHYLKKSAQAAADAAALAGVYRYNRTVFGSGASCSSSNWACHTDEWSCPGTITSAADPVQAACMYAGLNGFSNATANQKVTIVSGTNSSIPTAPAVNQGGWWITVRITQTVPQLFSTVLGNTNGTVAARATAVVQPSLACVYALDPAASASYSQNGNTQFLSGCGIFVNSSSSTAMLGVGGATVTAPFINVVGGYSWQGTMTPAADTGVSPVSDPLAGLQPPSPCSSTGGCDSASCKNNSKTLTISADTTLTPGTYCGGIYVKSGIATFSPGNYILVGGGIGTQDSNSHIAGTGVYFYNTYATGNSYSPISFNANSDVQISAPASGTYAGILTMEDRTCCASTIPTDSFQGGAATYFEGVIYSPKALVQFAGNASMTIAHYTVVVARQFSVQGSSTMNNDFSKLVAYNPIKTVGLVE